MAFSKANKLSLKNPAEDKPLIHGVQQGDEDEGSSIEEIDYHGGGGSDTRSVRVTLEEPYHNSEGLAAFWRRTSTS